MSDSKNWQSSYVVTPAGVKLHVRRSGGEKPPILVCHGFSDDGTCWPLVAAALAETHDVILADARGHGLSDAPRKGYGPEEMAGDAAEIITQLGLSKPAVLGHSMGAITAMALAGLHPELPGRVLLEDPPPSWMPEAPRTADPVSDEWPPMFDWIINTKRHTVEELMASEKANQPSWPDEEFRPWAESKIRMSFNVLSRFGIRMDWPPILQSITCPVLLITSDPARGGLVNAEQAQAFRALVPHAHVAHIAGAGHSIRRDQPAAYLAAVRDALTNS
jgi:pimeloyl-ACP methyl ester carboxylesterase